jgi:hypothetical protein
MDIVANLQGAESNVERRNGFHVFLGRFLRNSVGRVTRNQACGRKAKR